jgi:hypothetical protein
MQWQNVVDKMTERRKRGANATVNLQGFLGKGIPSVLIAAGTVPQFPENQRTGV